MTDPHARPDPMSAQRSLLRCLRVLSLATGLLIVGLVLLFLAWFRASGERYAAQEVSARLERQTRQALNARDIARERLHVAWNALDEMNSQLRDSSASGASDPERLRTELAGISKHFYEWVVDEGPAEDTTAQCEQARACWQLAETYRLLGQMAAAENTYQQALALYGELAKQHPEMASAHQNLARSYFSLARLYHATGNRAQAEQAFHEARAINRKLVRSYPDNILYRRDLAGSHHHLAALYHEWGKHSQAEQNYLEALSFRKQLTTAHPEDPDSRQALVITYNHLGDLYHRAGRDDEAVSAYHEGLTLSQALVDSFPQTPLYRHHVADIHADLAALYRDAAKPESAVQSYRAAIAMRRQLADAKPEASSHAVQLAESCNQLGQILTASGKAESALVYHTEAIQRLQPFLDNEARDPAVRHALSDGYGQRAAALIRLNRNVEAGRDLNRAIEIDCGKSRAQVRAERAASLARSGAYGHALLAADELAKCQMAPVGTRYYLAIVYAIAAQAVRTDQRYPAEERMKLAEQYAAQAVAMLDQAKTAAVFKSADKVEALKSSRDFDGLRSRADFQRLLAGVKVLGDAGRAPPAPSSRP
jgi:tetratricopeptide (TPR) repeat protein